MEERDYLQQLCTEILAIDKNIRFAGVIGSTGLLIVGQYRSDIESPRIRFSTLAANAKEDDKDHDSPADKGDQYQEPDRDAPHEQKRSVPISSFQASKMAFDLNRQFEDSLGTLNFQLSSFGKVTLVTITLTNRNDRFLCISIDPVPNSYDIVSKVLKAI